MSRTQLLAFVAPLCALSLTACPTPEGGRDAGRDAPVIPSDTPGVDTGGGGGGDSGIDTGGARSCTVGAASQCDVILQNCPTAGDGCYLATMGAGTEPMTLCAPVMGTLAEGMACSGLQECADGLHCAGGGTSGTCREYCCMGSAADCPIGQTCLPYGSGTTTFNVGVCTPPSTCEVIPQSGCDAGEACVPQPDTSRLCVSAGTVAVGAVCGDTAGNCVAGAACVGPTGGPTNCRAYCRIGMTDCTGTDTCMAIGGIDPAFGVCFPPG